MKSKHLSLQLRKWHTVGSTFRVVLLCCVLLLSSLYSVNPTLLSQVAAENVVQGNTLDWEWRNPLPQGQSLDDVTYGNSMYVAVGGGTILTSPDGLAWTIDRKSVV